jgi:hypothetical protein
MSTLMDALDTQSSTPHELMILDSSGDTRLQWREGSADEVAAARKRFDELKRKGYAAFKVNRSGGQGEQIDGFDVTAERVILTPPLVGG